MEILDLLKSTNPDDKILGLLLAVDNNIWDQISSEFISDSSYYRRWHSYKSADFHDNSKVIYKERVFEFHGTTISEVKPDKLEDYVQYKTRDLYNNGSLKLYPCQL